MAWWLSGCASPLPVVERSPSAAMIAPPASPLSSIAADAAIAPGRSGVWPLLQAEFALDARLAAIRAAITLIDLQYYLIADGAVAVVGGRNLADEYFLRGVQGNFIDFDLLCIGAVVGELSHWFDLYGTSTAVFPARAIAQAASAEPLQTEAAFQAAFEAATQADASPNTRPTPPTPAIAPDAFGAPRFSTALAERRFRFISAEAAAFAGSPDKIDPANHSFAVRDTLSHRFLGVLDEAHDEVYMFSPYFIPGEDALSRLRALRAAGVGVRVVTNSLAVSDEPLVAVGLARHQLELLRMGVELYELSSTRLKLDSALRNLRLRAMLLSLFVPESQL